MLKQSSVGLSDNDGVLGLNQIASCFPQLMGALSGGPMSQQPRLKICVSSAGGTLLLEFNSWGSLHRPVIINFTKDLSSGHDFSVSSW